jgi:adenine phosphoribosyltransferase
MESIASLIRAVPDFPQAGVLFRDITPLLRDATALRETLDWFVGAFHGEAIDSVAAIESRGFILGAPLAIALRCGFVPIRKLGKLPRETRSREYSLEYGTNHLEMHLDAVSPGDRVLIVDDVLATGGTARATIDLVLEAGGTIVGTAFLLEIAALRGRAALAGQRVECLLSY